MQSKRTIRIGARPSPLALNQAEELITSLQKIHPALPKGEKRESRKGGVHSGLKFDVIKIDTGGDKDKRKPIEKLEGTDFFTKEIEQALLKGKIDMAVHSAKDLPDVLPQGLEIAAILKSINSYDVLVSKNNLKLRELPLGAKIGTSSLRRKAQLKSFRKDFKICDIRGNIEERLRKLEKSELDAIVIAAAGLIRLGLKHKITQRLPVNIFKPHPLQGCLAVETKTRDARIKNLVSPLDSRQGVYLAGAGPGDPQLITIRGLELIKKADVIIYDFLINKKLLGFTRKDAELICVGKSSKFHLMEQDQINKLLAEKAKKFKIVVRLKNGDPFIFGRGGEEAVYLAQQNIPFHVVPGVSSAISVPASCGVPLTHRDYSSSVAIITGHRRKGGKVKFVNADTLVFLMAVANLEEIVKNLIKHGRPKNTPCILIERGASDDQRVVRGNLGNILQKLTREKITPPAVFVAGKVVNIRDILNKKKILFTGTDPQRFKDFGKIIHQPMIKIVPLKNYSKVEREIEQIDKYQWIIFTSRYGVKYFLNVVNRMKKDIHKLRNERKDGVKICAIGRTTANKLKEYGVKVDCLPQKESSQGIIATLKKISLKDKNILIPCSNLSGDYLSNALKKRGAYVKAIPVYRNIPPPRCKKIDITEINEIIFTSPSTVKNFMAEYKDIPQKIKLKCIGNVTLSRLKSYGFCGEVIR